MLIRNWNGFSEREDCRKIYNGLYPTEQENNVLLAGHPLLVCVSEKGVQGFAAYMESGSEVYLERICVREQEQNKGNGSALVKELIQRAGTKPISALSSRISFFERLGFKPFPKKVSEKGTHMMVYPDGDAFLSGFVGLRD